MFSKTGFGIVHSYFCKDGFGPTGYEKLDFRECVDGKLTESEFPCVTLCESCVNGYCMSETVCVCKKGWSGPSCNVPECGPDNKHSCRNGGKCVDGKCECPEKRNGDECSMYNRDNCAGIDSGTEKYVGKNVEDFKDSFTR